MTHEYRLSLVITDENNEVIASGSTFYDPMGTKENLEDELWKADRNAQKRIKEIALEEEIEREEAEEILQNKETF